MAPDDLPEIRTRWSEVSGGIDAAHAYQRRFDELASGGADLDGEARFVHALHEPPARILDAGCGTGRVATELTRLGHDVVGVDADAAMVEVARERDVVTRFVQADLATLSLSTQTFDVVLLAGYLKQIPPSVVRAFDGAGQGQPERPDTMWNFAGYLCTAWHHVHVLVE